MSNPYFDSPHIIQNTDDSFIKKWVKTKKNLEFIDINEEIVKMLNRDGSDDD